MRECKVCRTELGLLEKKYRCLDGFICELCYLQAQLPENKIKNMTIDEIKREIFHKDSDFKMDNSNSKNVDSSSAWTCPTCSQENKGADEICSRCLTPKPIKESANKSLDYVFRNNTVKIILIGLLIFIAIVFITVFVASPKNSNANVSTTFPKTTAANSEKIYYEDAQSEKDTAEADRVAQEAVRRKKEQVEQQKQKLEEQKKQEQAKKDKENFIASCIEVSYKDLARNPNTYIGKKLKITVEIQQVISSGFSTNAYRCYEDYDIHSGATYLDKEWYVEYYLSDDESRILEDDIVTFYGTYDGTSKLERALTGVTDYVPTLKAEYYETNTNTSTATTTMPKPTTTTKRPTTKPVTTTKPVKTLYNPSAVNGWSANGTGDYVAQGLIVEHYGVLSISHDGSRYFSVKAHNNDTGDYELLVNEIGPYNGTVLIPEGGNYDIEISSDGNWSINAFAIGITDGSSFNGHGDSVTNVFLTTNHNWKITNNNSEAYFSVKAHYTENEGDYDLLVNEIGNYNGVVRSDDSGSMFFEITSDGDWSISPAN